MYKLYAESSKIQIFFHSFIPNAELNVNYIFAHGGVDRNTFKLSTRPVGYRLVI